MDYMRVHNGHARTGSTIPQPPGSPVSSTDKMNITTIERTVT